MKKEDINRLIFIDESGSNLSFTREYARVIGGERIKLPKPYPRGNHYTMISAIGAKKVLGTLYGNWHADGNIFSVFIEKILCPELKKGDIILMDNVSFHKAACVETLIHERGAEIRYLPPYSPDFSPIENMWSKIKSTIRKYAPRTPQKFAIAMKKAFTGISQDDLLGWFRHCGYMPATI